MTNCCICQTSKFSKRYKKVNSYALLKCKKCGSIYLDSPTDAKKFIADAKSDLNKTNKNIEYWSFPEMFNKYSFVFDGFFTERFSRLLKYNNKIRSVFDIGAGYGLWLDFCRKQGMRVKGVDVSEEATRYAIEVLNLDVEPVSLDKYEFKEKYDVYNLCDVLEHLPDPNRELKMLYKIMDKDSLLYIQVPDVIGIKLPYGHNLGLPHHIWQFNYNVIKKLLEKNGFAILKKWHGVMGIIGNYEKKEVNALLKFKWFLARRLNLGNRLMVLCKKR